MGKEENRKDDGESFHTAKLAKSEHFTENWGENRANAPQL
jgi:hypothetical protein